MRWNFVGGCLVVSSLVAVLIAQVALPSPVQLQIVESSIETAAFSEPDQDIDRAVPPGGGTGESEELEEQADREWYQLTYPEGSDASNRLARRGDRVREHARAKRCAVGMQTISVGQQPTGNAPGATHHHDVENHPSQPPR